MWTAGGWPEGWLVLVLCVLAADLECGRDSTKAKNHPIND